MASYSLGDLVLMPHTQARAILRGNALRLAVLAPVGAHAGRGTLRVLRARTIGAENELICGYESYVPLRAAEFGTKT